MCVQKLVFLVPILILLTLGGCGPMDSLFPSIGNYKINVQINDTSLDSCSFARSSDRIRPFFEDSVSNDPDVTGLEVFLKDSRGMMVGWKIIYVLDKEAVPTEDDEYPEAGNEEDSFSEDQLSDENNTDVIKLPEDTAEFFYSQDFE